MFWLPLIQAAVSMVGKDKEKKDAAQQAAYQKLGQTMHGNNAGFAQQQTAGSVPQTNAASQAGNALSLYDQFRKNKPNADLYGGENSDQLLGDIGVS